MAMVKLWTRQAPIVLKVLREGKIYTALATGGAPDSTLLELDIPEEQCFFYGWKIME